MRKEFLEKIKSIDVAPLVLKAKKRREYRRTLYQHFYSKSVCTPEEWQVLQAKKRAKLLQTKVAGIT
jgi:hypothetical protein